MILFIKFFRFFLWLLVRVKFACPLSIYINFFLRFSFPSQVFVIFSTFSVSLCSFGSQWRMRISLWLLSNYGGCLYLYSHMHLYYNLLLLIVSYTLFANSLSLSRSHFILTALATVMCQKSTQQLFVIFFGSLLNPNSCILLVFRSYFFDSLS